MNYFLKESEKALWSSQLRWLTDLALGCRLEIDVASPTWGIQAQQQDSVFESFAYDDQNDIFHILTPSSDHSIESPREIAVNLSGNTLRSMSIRSLDGSVETILFLRPLRLSAPNEFLWPIEPPYRRPTDT